MNETLDALIRQLDLEPLEVNLFRGQSRDLWGPRVFGGQVDRPGAGRGRADDRGPASRTRSTPTSCSPATPTRPIVYQVERVRDGKSFSARRVQAIQHGAAHPAR